MELRLVLHVPESARFEVALKVACNFVKAVSGEPQGVRVLVNAEGVAILKRFSEVEDLYREALKQGVEVYFCENALRAQGLSPELLPPRARTVPAGIKALVEWQNQGFRYVRA
ncbi:MAG: hypothetical protein DSZ24_01360 [Thermodesulfatator sp.]|nr:MAG: hypothetical protein DSZ24_01360 [Thermodesulfatator sp.]